MTDPATSAENGRRAGVSGAFNLIARHLAAPFNKDVTAFINPSYHHNMVVGNRDNARDKRKGVSANQSPMLSVEQHIFPASQLS